MTTVNFPPDLGGDDVTIDDTDSPSTGLGNGGHRLRFVLALQQFLKVALWVKDTALAVLGYRDDAAGSAGAAAGSAAAAAGSAGAAATSAAQALGYLNDAKGRWYGALPEDPTVDPMGNPPNAGDGYFNTSLNQTRVYSGVAWLAPYTPTDSSAVNFQHSYAESVVRSQQEKSRDVYSFRDAGCIGNGVADDTTAVLRALASNRKVEGRPGDVYRVTAPIAKTDMQNLTIDLKGAEIRLDFSGVPTTAKHTMAFYSTAYGASKNIAVMNGKLTLANAPTARADQNFALALDGVDGIVISSMEIDKSWSAGIWVRRSNNVLFYRNYVHDTKADGLMAEGCGRNVVMVGNIARNTGDDSFALTWFTGNDPAFVGETDSVKRTKHVIVEGNQTYDSKGRGIFVGGAQGGSISENRIERANAIGILLPRDTVNASSVFYSTNGVNNSCDNLDVCRNTLIDCGVGSNSAANEVGGLWVAECNTRIKVSSNYAKGCNNVSFYAGGNTEFTSNISENPVLVATGTVPISAMFYKGGHFAVADFSATNTCFGRIEGNTCIGGVFRAVTVNTGYSARSWSVRRNKMYDVGTLSGSVDGISMVSLILVINIANATVRDNEAYETRSGSAIGYVVSVKDNTNNFVADNRAVSAVSGLGAELYVDNAGMNVRSRIRAISTQSDIILAAGNTYTFPVTITGAIFGMPATCGAPGDLQGADISAQVTAGATVTVKVRNPSAGAITVAGGDWRIAVGG